MNGHLLNFINFQFEEGGWRRGSGAMRVVLLMHACIDTWKGASGASADALGGGLKMVSVFRSWQESEKQTKLSNIFIP